MHGLYVTLLPLAQPTALTTEIHKLNETNKHIPRGHHLPLLLPHRLFYGHRPLPPHERESLSAGFRHTLLVLNHTEQACKTNEQSFTAKLTATRHKIEAGKRRGEAGREREQRYIETVNECGRQLLQQTQEPTEAKTQMALWLRL